MSAPTGRFRDIPIATTTVALNTPTKRLADVASQSIVSTGAGNELDFGTVDISAGAANSVVKQLFWDITADGGNTTVETFKFWMSSNGFDQAGSVMKFQPISGVDQTGASLTENYIVDAEIADYTWATAAETEPGSINVYPSDEGSSMTLSTTADDVVAIALYLAVASGETTGTYSGTTTDFELQMSQKFSYS